MSSVNYTGCRQWCRLRRILDSKTLLCLIPHRGIQKTKASSKSSSFSKNPTYAELEKKFKALEQEYNDYIRTTEFLRESHEKFKALFTR